MKEITIRQATLSDLDSVASLFNLYRQFYEQPDNFPLAKDFIQERIINGQSHILLAINESIQSVGFCQLYPTFCSVEAKPIYSPYDLFVMSNYRKLGIGRQLLLAAEKFALENGIARMDLTTAKNNHAAQSLYESLGWVRDEVFYAYSKQIKH